MSNDKSFIPRRFTASNVSTDSWQSGSMDFVFGFTEDNHKNTVFLVFFDQSSRWGILMLSPGLDSSGLYMYILYICLDYTDYPVKSSLTVNLGPRCILAIRVPITRNKF